MPLYLLLRHPKKRGTGTKGLRDYMHKYHKRIQTQYSQNSTAPRGAVPCYPVEAPQEFDEPGKELGPDAQVWKTYVREADQVDEELVDGWNKSMDVILIFAALFSTISTAFVIESYKNLKPDQADASSQTLLTISQTLMFIANGSQPSNAPLTSEAETPVFKASAKAICINVLWFLSLSLSVAASLISMLAKEWCLDFMAGRTGPPGAQARRRQQRWDGLVRWRMKEVIVMLPSLIHLSLLLFAIGLCVFLWDVHYGVAFPVVIVTTLAAGGYLACTILPFLYKFCPYGTVLSRLIKQFMNIPSQPNRADISHDEVTAKAIHWMIVNCETPRSVDIAYQSLAAADENLPADHLETCGTWAVVKRRLEADTLEQSEQSCTTNQLYQRALEVYPLTRRKLDLLNYGDYDSTRRLEQLVLGIQATINSHINDILHTGLKDDRTKQILMRCTMIGRHYLAEGRISHRSVNYESYQYAIAVEPVGLTENIIEVLEHYLKDEINLDPVMYSALSASFAFLMCCNAVRQLASKSVHVGHVLRLVRASSSGREMAASTPLWQTCVDSLMLGTLWLWISANYSANSTLAISSAHPLMEIVLETLWAGLISTMYLDRSALKRLGVTDVTYLAHGMLYLLANPGRHGLSEDDSAAVKRVLDTAVRKHGLAFKVQNSHHARYIQDVSDNLVIFTDVTAFTTQLLSALDNLRSYAPWDDKYLLPTPDIYMFVVNLLCLTSDMDSEESWKADQILAYSPIPKCSPRLVEQLFTSDTITHLFNLIRSDDPNKQVFATAQLWVFFNMSLREPDRSSPALNILEHALLKYPSLENSLERQEELAEELETRLAALLAQHLYKMNYGPQRFGYRILEVMLQQRSSPLPEAATPWLLLLPERLRGIQSFINLETERSIVYSDVSFDPEGRV
ncbi:unnamed protein product [Rhizoctonia solani]|uniref:DUF6535 domain-containing protein n=1 Tax=Rhizoctonia solani TaxID=456999 RepID=A0A8H3GQI9_9AGAM|nr:unnamed protein product [Rhizoctonia solani]